MIFIRYPFHCNLQLVDFEDFPVIADRITDTVRSYLGSDDFSLLYNGRKLQGMETIPHDSTIHVTFSLPGGKGGFGSMLRAIGAQIEKTTNREACRDLSGRRLRDINEEQRLKKWISKEAEREAEKIKRRQARIERLKTKAPHNFFDYEYEKEISALPDRITDALNEGLQKAKHPKKRANEESRDVKLPKKPWLTDDLPSSSSDSDSDEANTAGKSSPSKKPKLALNDSASCDSDMSESSQPQPCSSKDYMYEQSSSNDTNSGFADAKNEEHSTDSQPQPCSSKDSMDKQSSSSDTNSSFAETESDVQQGKSNLNGDESNASSLEMHYTHPEEIKMDTSTEETPQRSTEKEKSNDSSVSNSSTPAKQPEVQKDDSPIDLLDFESVSDLEILGLDRLKSALMSRGLKCGGTLSDRAQRLWKVRGLQPQEYPANLLAKGKK